MKEKNTEGPTCQLATQPAVQEIPMSHLTGIQELTSMLFLCLLYECVQHLNLQLLRELAFVPNNVLVKGLVNNGTRIKPILLKIVQQVPSAFQKCYTEI